MDAKELLKERLSRRPEIPYVEEGDRIEVRPADETGFVVALEESGDGATVFYEGWHEEFEDPEEAVQCFGFGLSEACRLRVTQRGSFPTGWAVESFRDGKWVQDGVTGLLVASIWKRKNVVYKQNRWLGTA